ncbi:MAG TPA: hypothetical protein VGB85_31855, partial [Nannocystis sp.]
GKPRRSVDPTVTIEEPATRTALEDLLDAPVARRVATPTGGCLIASCVEERHPTLQGRVQVQLVDGEGHPHTLWVPTLQGLPVRKGDRLLLVRPGNGDEWIATGVVDGFARRPEVSKVPAAQLELKSDECVQVVSSAGQPLVEVSQGSAGPVVRLLEPDVRVEFAGKLVLRAEGIELEATGGQVEIKASEDVVIKGELVRLN